LKAELELSNYITTLILRSEFLWN